ncbi:MAG: 3-dehydroquinate synthase [Clostridia bacterium]|nr:3-dehydroquinate synthase [Clostridia bacterium]
MIKVEVPASVKYDVLIGDVINSLSGRLYELFGKVRYAVICDENVKRLHGQTLSRAMTGLDTAEYILPSGENSKSISQYEKILDFLAESSLTRKDVIIAVGGGVTGDISGFCAASYLRGIRFVQVPTTLLAMTDSSVGGKTAVNITAGKNLVGAFHQPSLVMCHTPFLRTLPPEIYSDGMAEVIKYGVIRDGAFFEKLSCGMNEDEMIARCVEIKRDVVVADEKESGERVILNFGHTAAHAVEKLSGFEISHGSAVAMGMLIAAASAENNGICEKGTAEKIKDVLHRYGHTEKCPFSPRDMAQASRNDKKTEGGEIKLVLPEKIGKCTVKRVSVDKLEAFFGLEASL